MNLYFSGGGFPCCIRSTQIHFLCFPGKLESAVIPHRRAHLSLFTWQFLHRDNIWYILAVGTELFWSLKKEEVRRHFQGGTHKFNQSKNRKCISLWQLPRNLCDLCTFQNKCMLSCLCMWSPETFIHQSRRPVGAEKKEMAVRWAARQKHCTSLLTLKKSNFFYTRQVYGFTARVCGRTQYINSACAIRVKQ